MVPPPVKSQSTVGAGDSMVGAMTLKLAENASLEEMVRFGVAAGSAATLNQEHACAPMTIRKKFTLTFPLTKTFPSIGGITTNLSATRFSDYAQKSCDNKGVNYGQWRSCPLCNNRHVA